jgi:hypothetical protein
MPLPFLLEVLLCNRSGRGLIVRLRTQTTEFSFKWSRFEMVHHATKVAFFTFTPWSESASELYQPSDRRLSAK